MADSPENQADNPKPKKIIDHPVSGKARKEGGRGRGGRGGRDRDRDERDLKPAVPPALMRGPKPTQPKPVEEAPVEEAAPEAEATEAAAEVAETPEESASES